jgi:hypothetical protein
MLKILILAPPLALPDIPPFGWFTCNTLKSKASAFQISSLYSKAYVCGPLDVALPPCSFHS